MTDPFLLAGGHPQRTKAIEAAMAKRAQLKDDAKSSDTEPPAANAAK